MVYYHLPKNKLRLEQLCNQSFTTCIHSAPYDDFSILARENRKFLFELKESLLIMTDRPSLSRHITAAPLDLCDRS